MIVFQPVSIVGRNVLGQGAPVQMPAAPAGTLAVPVEQISDKIGGLMSTLKWGTIGFAAGAATGYVLGKGAGSKSGGLVDSLLGGVGGVVASLLPRLLGISG